MLVNCLLLRILQVDAVYFFTEGSAADSCKEMLSDQVRAVRHSCIYVQLSCVLEPNLLYELWYRFARSKCCT